MPGRPASLVSSAGARSSRACSATWHSSTICGTSSSSSTPPGTTGSARPSKRERQAASSNQQVASGEGQAATSGGGSGGVAVPPPAPCILCCMCCISAECHNALLVECLTLLPSRSRPQPTTTWMFSKLRAPLALPRPSGCPRFVAAAQAVLGLSESAAKVDYVVLAGGHSGHNGAASSGLHAHSTVGGGGVLFDDFCSYCSRRAQDDGWRLDPSQPHHHHHSAAAAAAAGGGAGAAVHWGQPLRLFAKRPASDAGEWVPIGDPSGEEQSESSLLAPPALPLCAAPRWLPAVPAGSKLSARSVAGSVSSSSCPPPPVPWTLHLTLSTARNCRCGWMGSGWPATAAAQSFLSRRWSATARPNSEAAMMLRACSLGARLFLRRVASHTAMVGAATGIRSVCHGTGTRKLWR